MSNNGAHIDPGPPFGVVSQKAFVVNPYRVVLEQIEKNAQEQSKANLKLGPLFRKIADDFREYARVAEPGQMFQAPEVSLVVIRMSAFAPVATSLSDEARKRLQDSKEEVTAPRIVTG